MSEIRKITLYEKFVKRGFDFLGAFFLIMILSPIMLVIALLVRIKHGKGVIFKQNRVGKDKRVFEFYKFRSMSNKRDKNGDLLPDKYRITKFGKLIRKSSLDELPQLWNILKGDMSFVGPRPKDVRECVFFNKEQCARFEVKPGITGLAQVHGRNSINFESVVVYDVEYIKKVTFWKDTKIFFKTFLIVFNHSDIDAKNHNANNFCYYYNDLLLQRGDITPDVYDKMVKFSKTLKVGDIMPSIDEQRVCEEIKTTTLIKKGLQNLEEQTKAQNYAVDF